ncbi:universal stress protein [Natronococcus sp. A-GB1]|uniref:universal stress protein n=1 Tax=Natronococcus sp. A-GB1 TaxID=3037648 RepID=UPI00241E84FC|nr:universal stress protein [Natronococcus sp. A-GB1]MDG5760215.1 universal stress protein [Natronococcus sp. A-GB1]
MTRTVLVPTEGSPLSMKALETALTDYPDADIVVCHVMDPIGSGLSLLDVMRPTFDDGSPPGSVSPEYWREWHKRAESKAQAVFDDAREIAAEHDRSVETVLEFGEPDDVILEYAEGHDIDRIVMGSHCRTGAERFLLGSVAETVVKRAPVPVLIVR